MRRPGSGVSTIAAAIVLVVIAGGVLSSSLLHSAASNTFVTKARLLVLLNQERTAHGLHPLTFDAKLGQAAQSHSASMLRRGYFAHSGPQGPWDVRIRRYVTRRYIAEILAYGSGANATPSGIVSAWMHSPSHRRIVLTPELRLIGLGLATGTFHGQPNVAMTSADFSSP
jgi:uncharacterized protein YkwD